MSSNVDQDARAVIEGALETIRQLSLVCDRLSREAVEAKRKIRNLEERLAAVERSKQ